MTMKDFQIEWLMQKCFLSSDRTMLRTPPVMLCNANQSPNALGRHFIP